MHQRRQRELVLKIHKTPHKAVLTITGGGSEAIGELLRYGEGSNTLLEAIVPYEPRSFDAFVKGKPDKYCSTSAARDLAMAAFQRATAFGNEQNVGVGVTCSLRKDGERDGRRHAAYIAVQTDARTQTHILTHDQLAVGETRDAQEAIVSNAIIRALADACHVASYRADEIAVGDEYQHSVITGKTKIASFVPGNSLYEQLPVSNSRIIYSGAFNPLHEAHASIAAKVHSLTGKPIDLELTVRNVDKPALNYIDLQHRLAGCVSAVLNQPWIGYIHLTGLPTFVEKAEQFPNSVFIVGFDTWKRINDPKYGDLQDVYDAFYQNMAKFLVFHRIIDGVSTENEVLPHTQLKRFATILSSSEFQPMDHASSKIRKAK